MKYLFGNQTVIKQDKEAAVGELVVTEFIMLTNKSHCGQNLCVTRILLRCSVMFSNVVAVSLIGTRE